MGKNIERATAHNRVQAVFSKFKRDKKGNLTNIPLYDINAPEYLKI